jgi:predicted transposase YbfD/YdcC
VKAKAVLSALDVCSGLVLAQREVSEEHLEIPEFIPLLRPLNLAGTVVTADAMHTQREHANFLVEEKQAHFLFVVKDNNHALFGELNRWPEDRWSAPISVLEKGHGRVERRTIWTSSAVGHFLPFPQVHQVIRIRREVSILASDEIREETSYAVTSLPANAARGDKLLEISRAHWQIENGLHYVKDMAFGEDASRVRQGATAFALVRSHTLALIRAAGYTSFSAAIREFAWNWHKAFAALGV